MTTDADRLLDLDEAIGRIGVLAYKAWNDGNPSYREVVEEVVLTCDDLLDGNTHNTLRTQIEDVIPETWCPDLPLAERVRKMAEIRRAWLICAEAKDARIRELELKANDYGTSPLAIDPVTVARLRLTLQRNPRSIIITGSTIKLLRDVFGVTHGPTTINPSIICPTCHGDCIVIIDGVGPSDCLRCGGEGKVPDVDSMRLRLAELEAERDHLLDAVNKGNDMMGMMRGPNHAPPEDLWLDFELALAAYRHNGYEYSDHPDDFTAPGDDPAD